MSFLPRLTYVPTDPVGRRRLRGTLEVGAEGWLQFFREPVETAAEGLKAVARYDFLGLRPSRAVRRGAARGGRQEPPAVGQPVGVHVRPRGGSGLSYMITPTVAVTGGYCFQHLSDGGVGERNRGYNYDGGVVGVSIFFP